MVYLDNNATTPIDPAVADKMTIVIREHFGNPSSLYPIGRTGKEMINEARDHVAAALGASKASIYFTGSGTESDNQAILGVLDALPDKREFVTSTIEHPAVQETAVYLEGKGYRVTYVPVDATGTIDLNALRDAVTPQTALVSVMHANNEIGTIQPISDVVRIAHEQGSLVHTDAVQTFGKIPFKADDLGVDLLSVSAHKIY
jgi:cysteine desulfurase